MLDHLNVKEVIAESVDKYNDLLERAGASKRLSDDEEQFQSNYLLYVARKNGLPKDDLPGTSFSLFDCIVGFSQNTGIKSQKYQRYALCIFVTALVEAKSKANPKPDNASVHTNSEAENNILRNKAGQKRESNDSRKLSEYEEQQKQKLKEEAMNPKNEGCCQGCTVF